MLYRNRDKIYVAAGIAFMLLLFNTGRCIPDTIEDFTNYPDMTINQIMSEQTAIQAQIQKPFSNYKEYFDVVDRLLILELACKKYERNHESLDPRYPTGVRSVIASIQFLRIENEGRDRKNMFSGNLKQRMARKKECDDAMANRDHKYFDMLLHPKRNPELDQRFVRSLALFQLAFMPFALLIYAVRIGGEGGSVFIEAMSNPLFPFYILFWEIGLFKYHASGLRQQMRRMVRYASLTVSTVLSFGGVVAKAQTKKSVTDSSGSNGHTLVISGNTQYLSKYLGLDGAIFHPGRVLQSSLTLAHTSGAYVNFWKSKAATGINLNPNFGNEEDYTAGFTKKFGKRTVDVSATYFNVTPLGKLAGGDLLQTSVNISDLIPRLPISHYFWVRNVHPLKDASPPGGWFVHFGMSRSQKVIRKIQFALSGEAVFDSGAFGYKRAGIFRGAASLKIPWKKFVLEVPTYKMSTPFTRPSDGRKLEHVLGVSLSFSFAQ